MQEHLKPVRINEKETVDPDTGEILLETKVDKIIAGNSGEFYQIYADILSVIEKIKPVEAKVFISMFHYANSTNTMGVPKGIKEEIAKKNDIAYSAVANAITGLVKANLLIRISESFYRINPRYFWKSTSQSRKATLKYVLELECPGC